MANRALQAWRRSQRIEVVGFEANAMLVSDPGGEARIEQVAPAIAATFALRAGQLLCDTPPGMMSLENELRDACDLVALDRVQIIVNWRELLSRSASGRLKRELGAALQSLVRPNISKADPFSNLNA
jgi:hypothetical protein